MRNSWVLISITSLILASCSEAGPSDEQVKKAFVDDFGGADDIQINSFEKIGGENIKIDEKAGYKYSLKANVTWANGRFTKCKDRDYNIHHGECWALSPGMMIASGATRDVTADIVLTKTDRGWQSSSGKVY